MIIIYNTKLFCTWFQSQVFVHFKTKLIELFLAMNYNDARKDVEESVAAPSH